LRQRRFSFKKFRGGRIPRKIRASIAAYPISELLIQTGNLAALRVNSFAKIALNRRNTGTGNRQQLSTEVILSWYFSEGRALNGCALESQLRLDRVG
jgi:hypothetical protein